MSEEKFYNEQKQECKCFCNSKGFKKFLITALGSFVGVFCALSLFTALHKPPMMMAPCTCPCMYRHMPPPMHAHFDKRNQQDNFHIKNFMKENYSKKELPIKVNIDD